MTRRSFFEIAAAGFCLAAGSVLAANSRMQVLYRKIKGRLRSEPASAATVSRRFAELPGEGEHVSVELALNSRCTSDHDGDPEIFHWGMFDNGARISSDQIRRIANLAEPCRMADSTAKISVHEETLTFLAASRTSQPARDVSMIESGMQQQAVCLACAALGVAMVFESLGPDGTDVSPQEFITTRMRLGAMKASYNGSYWNASVPSHERPWMMGNLPEPTRSGTTPLVMALEKFRLQNGHGGPASTSNLGQLLWAARGRTPHLYKSQPWGLTIPTWQGLQNISSVYVVGGSQLFPYSNWKSGRPTHRLEEARPVTQLDHLRSALPDSNCFLVLSANEPHARALWEVGYQLLNIILQASALGVAYRTLIVDDRIRVLFDGIPMGTPAAVVGIHLTEEQFFHSI